MLRLPVEGRAEVDFLLLRGACLARMRRGEEARAAFSRLLSLDPDCHEALTWMAVLARDPGDMEEALGYAQRAVELRPEDAAGYGALGSGYLAAQRPDAAIAAFGQAVELTPDAAEHRHNLALAYLMAHRHGEAIAQLREAIRLAPHHPQSYLQLASAYSQFGMAGQAIECLSEGLRHLPDCPPLHSALAGAYSSLRNEAAAERHHRRALELSPESRSGYGAWLLNQGRFDESNAVFEAMLREGTDTAYALYGLMQARKTADEGFVARMESLLHEGRQKPRSEMYLRYALGKAEEGHGRYGEAMAHFDAANRGAEAIYHGGRPTDPARFAREHEEVRVLYESMPQESGSTESPIFIIGMIRSGTTLLDQILSSHPQVASGGELRFWMEETQRLVRRDSPPDSEDLRTLAEEYAGYARLLAGSEPRFTDKMPLNFTVAGVIHRAMPNARFLHIRRHPIDTCLSIWTTFFGQGPLFAYDKANIVAYYRQYRRTMATWREALPSDRLTELEYEDLIADPEPTIRRVVEFCGLPWDDACLHHDQNASAIYTPSRWQARQPIYRTSVKRWRRYEPWLGEFAELEEW